MTEHGRDQDCTLDESGTCTICGVWHGEPCPACGGRGFHRETCPELASRPLRAARFGIDAVEDALFEGFTAGERWNGFACPYFTKEQADKVLEAFQAAGDAKAHYDAATDEYVFHGLGEEQEEPDRYGPTVIGGVTYYQVGSFGWCWWQEDDFGDDLGALGHSSGLPMTQMGGPVRWERDEPRVVWARLPSRGRRVTALRVGRAAGLVRLWARGRTWVLPEATVSRPRRNGVARVIGARLRAEFRAYEAAAAGLEPHRRGRERR